MALKEAFRNLAKKPPTVAELEQRLVAAEAELNTLKVALEEAALAMATDDGAEAAYVKAGEKVAHATAKVNGLRNAIPAAKRAQEQELIAARTAVQKAQVESVRQHLLARDKAAIEFERSLAETIKHWRVMINRGEKARTAAPVGQFPDHATYSSVIKINELVAHELWRQGSDPTSLTGAENFPGARIFSHQTRHDPSKIPSISDQLKQSTAHVMAALNGSSTHAESDTR